MTGTRRLTDVGKPSRLFVIGDSNVLAFKDVLLKDDENSVLFQSRAVFIRGLRGHNFTDDNGHLNKHFVNALVTNSLLTKQGVPPWLSEDQREFNIAFAASEPQMPPPILLQCGDIDCRSRIMKELTESYDFEIPDSHEVALPDIEPEGAPSLIPFKQILPLFEHSIDRFTAGLRALLKSGYSNIAVHCVPPPTTNKDLFIEIHEFYCPLLTRHKVCALYNFLLARECDKLGIPFIDIWPQITGDDGLLLPEREFDGVHLSRGTARDSLDTWLTAITGTTHRHFNARLWSLTQTPSVSEPLPPGSPSGTSGNSSSGVTVLQDLDGPPTDLFEQGQRGLVVAARPDWCSDPCLARGEGREIGPLSEKALETLSNWLYDADTERHLAQSLGYSYVCYNAALIRGSGSDGLLLHAAGSYPVPFLKVAIFHRSTPTDVPDAHLDVSEGSENYTLPISDGQVISIHNHSGEVAVTGDLNHWQCLVLWLGIRVNGVPRLTLQGGENCWPADPFQYSVNGFAQYPASGWKQISIHPARKIYNVG